MWRASGRMLGMVLIPFICCVLLVLSYTYTVPNLSAPQAQQGMMDLTEWEFGAKRTVYLHGEWSFYPSQLYPPQDFSEQRVPSTDMLASIPNAWYGGTPVDEASQADYGTYRLLVRLDDEGASYGIRVPNVNGAHRLYVNGLLVGQSGHPAVDESNYVKENKPYTTFARAEDGVIDIVLHTASFESDEGGFEDIQLGLQSDMLMMDRILFAVDFAGAFLLLIFAGYHMIIYVLRMKDKAYLYSSLYFLSMFLLMVISGESILMQFIPRLSYETLENMYGIGGFIHIVLLGLFLHQLDDKLLKRSHLIILLTPICLASAALLIIPEASQHLLGNLPWDYATFVVGFYAYRAVRLYWRNDGRLSRAETALVIGILLSMALILLFALFYSLNLVQTDIGRKISFLLVLMFMSALLALRLKNATEQAEQLTHELIMQDQLKNEFLANTSHELKTPLHGIQHIASFLLDETAGQLTERQRSELTLIQHTSTRLSTLVQDLLDVVRLRHGELNLQPTTLDLQVVAGTVFHVLEFELTGKDVHWDNQIPPNTYIRADDNRLRQVLYNVIHNAIKHTKSGRIVIGAEPAGDMTKIWVEDTGIGIPEERHEDIFGYFEQVDREPARDGYTGMGLGLYISRRLVDRMGGRIWVDWSAPGLGTRIACTLPTVDLDAGDARSDGAIAASSVGEGRRSSSTYLQVVEANRTHTVLIVDDEVSNVHVLFNLLGDEYNVLSAFSAQDALRKLDEYPAIDLMILDVMMPEMSGIDLCRLVREKRSVLELPILFATVKDSLQDIELCFRVGGNDFISKPFDPKTLAARVHTLLSMKSAMDQAVASEMAFLQAQIKPHFLYNAISSIVSFCYTDGEKAAYLLSMLSRYLRMVFDRDGRANLIPLGQELELIQAYIEIEKARFGDRLVYRQLVEPELQTLYLPSLTLQPFVENAIRHGLFEQEEGGTVTLSITDGDGFLRIDISDDGVGMPDDILYRLCSGDQPEGAGIGVTNVHKRLATIPGARMTIDSAIGQGTKITIFLPKIAAPD